jgi:hypothetical protein
VTLLGFGTAGTTFAAPVTAATGIVNTARQIGAAFGAAVLVAIAESASGAAGMATVRGDRHAVLAGAASPPRLSGRWRWAQRSDPTKQVDDIGALSAKNPIEG